jgi:hypothetical protein
MLCFPFLIFVDCLIGILLAQSGEIPISSFLRLKTHSFHGENSIFHHEITHSNPTSLPSAAELPDLRDAAVQLSTVATFSVMPLLPLKQPETVQKLGNLWSEYLRAN